MHGRVIADGTANAGPRTGRIDVAVPAMLLSVATLGWWISARMAGDMDTMAMPTAEMAPGAEMAQSTAMSMSLSSYLVGWVAMMTAMMFPAIVPMVKLYARAAARGSVAPVPYFLLGYLVVWSTIGLPAFFAWRALAEPLSDGELWVGRLAGGTFLLAGIYQITPLKRACLQHCRSPISFFLRHGGSTLGAPRSALRLGLAHGTFCLGCCWAIMAVLVAVGTMHLGWMVLLTALILLEKVAPRGERISLAAGSLFTVVGAYLLVAPTAMSTIT